MGGFAFYNRNWHEETTMITKTEIFSLPCLPDKLTKNLVKITPPYLFMTKSFF